MNYQKKNKSKFFFINLDSNKSNLASQIKFSKENNIKFFDCGYAEINDDYRVENDGHPNKKLHKIYADCIFNSIFK